MARTFFFSLLSFCFLVILPRANARDGIQPHSIVITVEASGRVFMGPDTIFVDKLADDLQQRLWKSWLSTGKMYDAIRVEFRGEVLMGVRGAALDAIKEAQDKTLVAVCLEKYKQNYESLSDSKKRKLKREFPVLFQQMKW